MLNILIVDDIPHLKVDPALDYLKYYDKLEFNRIYTEDVNSALRYIKSNSDKIDFIILDLGLPLIKDGDLEALCGLYVLQFMVRYKYRIPVIINSSTSIPNEEELIDDLKDAKIEVTHVKSLNPDWLSHFIKFDLPNIRNN